MESPRRPLIVVLDDDDVFLELMKQLLEFLGGYTVEITTRGEAGCGLVRHARPDLVILDVVFAGEEQGWAVLERLKGDPATASIPILVCSASDRALRKHRALLERHEVPALVKPFELQQLLDAIERELAGRVCGAPA